MRNGVPSPISLVAALLLSVGVDVCAAEDGLLPLFRRAERQIMYHDFGVLPESSSYGADYRFDAEPPTLSEPREYRSSRPLSLDEAIKIALEHVEVVRTLSGNAAQTSRRTIYDAAITSREIAAANAAFDPTLEINNTWVQNEDPGGDVGDNGFVSVGRSSENYAARINVSQRNMLGGTASLRFDEGNSVTSPQLGPFNPIDTTDARINYTQPLLRGGGIAVNRAPIVIARLNTERSFFQFRGAMQGLIAGVAEAYWNVVAARTSLWAREKQVEQATVALERAEARLKLGISDITEVTQARSGLANFRTQKIRAEATLLNRESALQNILGLPASSASRLVPTSPPLDEQLAFNWAETFSLAERRRPDILELKLVYAVSQQQYLQSKNNALPTLNATGSYNWDGFVGTLNNGSRVSSEGGEFTDWTLAVNFSVPLFLREERANLRSAELVLARDRANIKQVVHATEHSLALTLRLLEQSFLEYEASKEARAAARLNLERQLAANEAGTEVIFLNVLQAISDWGNAVSEEADALLNYNTTLAKLEQETGTILETHGIWFIEDQQCNVGPRWLKHRRDTLYPAAHRPTLNDARYENGDKASEEFFDLEDYPGQDRESDQQDDPVVPPRVPAASDEPEEARVRPVLQWLGLRYAKPSPSDTNVDVLLVSQCVDRV